MGYKKENDSIQSKETLSDERFVEFVNSWREVMEVTNTLYLIARHSDTDHDHVHLVASRIRLDGSVVDDSWDYRRSEVAVRQLEKKFGLEPVRCSSFSVAEKLASEGIEVEVSTRRALTRKQLPHSSGEPSIAERVADIIDEAIQDRPTVTQLIGRLQQQGVKVHPTFSTRGQPCQGRYNNF